MAARWAVENEHLFPIGNADLYQPDLDIDLMGGPSVGERETGIEIELL